MTATRTAYRAREFAELAGVTVRALHHYDRLGLLTPRRTPAGYRLYSANDLEALEQIVVLKFIGLSLKDIAALRRQRGDRLAQSLRAQGELLKAKQRALDQAIGAIAALEAMVASDRTAEPVMFRRIIEVIEMQNNNESKKQEYDELVRTKIDRLRSLSPGDLAALQEQWRTLVAEIKQSLGEDPTGARAQAFATRWTNLLQTLIGHPVSRESLGDHQQAREWDPRMASFVEKSVWDFMTRVLSTSR